MQKVYQCQHRLVMGKGCLGGVGEWVDKKFMIPSQSILIVYVLSCICMFMNSIEVIAVIDIAVTQGSSQ